MTDEAPPPQPGHELAPPAGLRPSHADPDRVVELLRVAAGDGRLTAEELDERLETALTARTYGELAALSTDLPAIPQFAPGAPVPEPKDLARIECHGSSVQRDGRWLVPQRMQVPVILRIQVSGKVSSGHITARPPRRATRPWLGRHP